MTINKDWIGEEIVKSFHEQFAQNQNHHQKLFLQVLTVLLTVLVGFGYLFIRVGISNNEINVTVDALYAYLTLALYLLSLGVALISNMALSFRRDQLVACNIRVKTNVLNPDEYDKYFPDRFNPVGKTGKLTWMPEFHFIFFWALFVFKLLLICSVFFRFPLLFNFTSANKLISFSVISSFISFVIDFIIAWRYWKKWKIYSDAAPDILKKQHIT